MTELKRTPLFDLHSELGARMVPFAGYEMPVQYALGVLQEHNWTREKAGLFDVSHMGQLLISPLSGDIADAALALEELIPVDIVGLAQGRQRYGFFTNEAGGILDDLMIANRGDHFFVVVNAACKDADEAHLRAAIGDRVKIEVADRALLALQGPEVETVLAELVPLVADIRFMDVLIAPSDFGELWISRSGYSGEDGYEISVEPAQAVGLSRALLASDKVEAIGLGARDSLRLEAGLCLYGHDIDEGTSPVEASLLWAIQKSRRTGGIREGGFRGAKAILGQIANGVERMRIGLLPEGRAPMREGTPIFDSAEGGTQIGVVTSGAFGPTIGRPMSMGYVATDFASKATTVWGEVRGKRLPAAIADLPFRPSQFKK